MWIKGGGKAGYDVVQDQLLQTLCDDMSESHRAEVNETDSMWYFFEHRNKSGGFQTCWHIGLQQGGVGPCGEDLGQLLCTGL